ncbi:MAG: MipA/OmpV family protein [Candidatus Tectomicrobia bacterium]|nr:MipA/OmpV family protein [Candidatus Tectomicrobia bacterium]
MSIAFLLGLLVASPVLAQDTPIAIDTVPNFIGVGLATVPDYLGSDDYTIAIGLTGRLGLGGERFIQLSGPLLTANLINHPNLQLGPALRFRRGRDDVDDDVVDRMADIDSTFEAGLLIGFKYVNPTNRRQRFRAGVTFTHDVAGEHEGFVIDVFARAWWPLSKRFDVGLGAGLTFADDDYMETYFSVTPSDAMRSGLPIFDAEGGVRDFRVFPTVVWHLSRHWHLGAGLRYSRLVSDAEDSPVVDDRGSANQLAAGAAILYSW